MPFDIGRRDPPGDVALPAGCRRRRVRSIERGIRRRGGPVAGRRL